MIRIVRLTTFNRTTPFHRTVPTARMTASAPGVLAWQNRAKRFLPSYVLRAVLTLLVAIVYLCFDLRC